MSILKTNQVPAFLVRLAVGVIFLSEGIQKYLFPGSVGTARFEKIGFAHPSFWAYFTGSFEIVCGLLILIGFLARFAAVPLLIIMIVAFVTTKVPVLVDKGFWAFMHEYRTDFAMTLLLIYILADTGSRHSLHQKPPGPQ
jgi:uncharacterized membrane protein YphA (DoxX/SURF4 family)